MHYPTGPFSISELERAKSKILEAKAAGPYNISPEVIKWCDLDDIILDIAKSLLIKGEKSNQWSRSNIIPVPKKGDLSNGSNYRGISLNAIIAKLTNRLVLNRIQPVLDLTSANEPEWLRTRQIKQPPRYSPKTYWGSQVRRPTTVILFLDFRKAFDRRHRGTMLRIFKEYGIPEELVNAIANMNENTQALVLSPDGETDWFEITKGVLQGDAPAPHLFTIVLDYTMRQALKAHGNPAGVTVEPRNVGLYLLIKTKIDGSIRIATDFKYLGPWIDDSENMKTRKAQA